jgi:hypothetical protein
MPLRNWRFRRVVGLGVLWIIVALGILVVRSIAFARQVQPQPRGDFYVVLLHVPGGLWPVFGPPVLLAVLWVAMQRSRPAS